MFTTGVGADVRNELSGWVLKTASESGSAFLCCGAVKGTSLPCLTGRA